MSNEIAAAAGPGLNLASQFRTEVDGMIAFYKQQVSDGFNISDIWALTTSAIASFTRLFQSAVGADGATKKQAVLVAAGQFYDTVVAPLNIPTVPGFIETTFVDPAVRRIFLSLAEGAVDAVIGIFAVEDRAAALGAVPGGQARSRGLSQQGTVAVPRYLPGRLPDVGIFPVEDEAGALGES